MKILFISHNSPSRSKHFGGTEHLYKEIIDAASSANIDFFEMTPEIGSKQITWQIRNIKGRVWELKQPRLSTEPYFFGNHQYSNWMSEFLVNNRIDLVHIFHQMWTPLSTIPIAQNLGITTVTTIHDFSHICDSFNLLDENSTYCKILEQKNSNKCSSCACKRGSSTERLTLLRAAYFKIFEKVDVVTVGTHFSKTHLINFYNLEPSKILIIPPKVTTNISVKTKVPKTILILGNFTIPKGAKLSLELMKNVQLKDFAFIQAGRIDHDFISELKSLDNSRDKTSILGQYSLGEIPNITASIAFFGSIWPETYCIAASEALEMGLKIVVPEIGAFIDRFKGMENIFFYEPENLESAIASILIADNFSYVEVHLPEDPLYSSEILKLYIQLGSRKLTSGNFHSEFNSWETSNINMLGFHNNDSNFLDPSRPSLVKVFIARSKSVGWFQALADAFSYIMRKLN